jgi:hypothetical protein
MLGKPSLLAYGSPEIFPEVINAQDKLLDMLLEGNPNL